MGIRREAMVADIAFELGWQISRCRNQLLKDIAEQIRSIPCPRPDAGDGVVLWRYPQNVYRKEFSATMIWEQIRRQREKVNWSRIIWFSQGVPRYAFTLWLATMDHLSTGARTRGWRYVKPCVFCEEPNETRDHILFCLSIHIHCLD